MILIWLKHLARLYLPIYLYESDKMKIVYAGYSFIKKNYFVRLFLEDNYHQTFLGRRLFWKIPGLIKSGKNDFVISEISRIKMDRFMRYKGYILPELVLMRINIDRPVSEIFNKNTTDFPNVIRRIRKYNLTYEILNDKESLNCFIEKLYLPYMTNRHGDEALIEDLNKVWESSSSPFLMAIREDGIIVAKSIMRKSGDCLCFRQLGILDGNEDYLRHGVIGALYYFGILEGQKMKCHYFDVGGTRPFLSDGLTKYKMGLGAEFVSDYSSRKEYLWFGVNEQSAEAENFMKNNPFLYLNKDYGLNKYSQ